MSSVERPRLGRARSATGDRILPDTVTQKPTSASGQRWRSSLSNRTATVRASRPASEAFDLGAEFLLPLGEIIGNVLRERVGHVLAEQRLLAFEQELLVAQRAHGQPREHEARQQDRDHKNQRDFFHGFTCILYPAHSQGKHRSKRARGRG